MDGPHDVAAAHTLSWFPPLFPLPLPFLFLFLVMLPAAADKTWGIPPETGLAMAAPKQQQQQQQSQPRAMGGGSVAAEAGEKDRPNFVIRKRSAR